MLSYVIELKGMVEQEGTLELGAQLVLLHRFEEKLDDLENNARLEKLLVRFRKRPDLLASVQPQVDDLMNRLRAFGAEAMAKVGEADEPVAGVEPTETTAPDPHPQPTDGARRDRVHAAFSAHAGVGQLAVGPELPRRLAEKIVAAHGLAGDEEVLGAFDLTVFGTGGIHLAFTDRRVLYKNGGTKHVWDLGEIATVPVEPAGSGSRSDIKFGDEVLYWNGTDTPISVQIIREVFAAARGD